jgi:spermidine/putrescine transport system permease protein
VLVFLPASGDFANAEFLGSPATSMIGNVINGTFNQGGYVPLGGTLTVCFMVGIAAFMVFYLRSAARASREGAM